MSDSKTFLDRLAEGAGSCSLENVRVLVAVSGGADSVALLCGLVELSPALGLQVVAAHLNHLLRGAESDADAGWVAKTCVKLKTELIAERADVHQSATESATGVEETARRLRYDFLTQAANEADCPFIAVAHTADDQAETILHHVIRGTGLAGLRGMPRTRKLTGDVLLVRPLLDVNREEILAYLHSHEQDFREDRTNRDETFTRNRLRHSLLPLLEREYNPRVREVLLRLGQQAGETQSTVESLADELLARAVLDRNPECVRLDWQRWESQPRHIVRECFARLWVQQNWPRQGMGFAQWDRLAGIAIDGGATTLPGNITARRRDGLVVLSTP